MARNHGKDADISRTTGSAPVHERRNANPDTEGTTDPKEVWRTGETMPSPDGGAGTGASGRVADGGDLDKAEPSPYSTETQAEAIAGQTDRKDDPQSIDKPKQ